MAKFGWCIPYLAIVVRMHRWMFSRSAFIQDNVPNAYASEDRTRHSVPFFCFSPRYTITPVSHVVGIRTAEHLSNHQLEHGFPVEFATTLYRDYISGSYRATDNIRIEHANYVKQTSNIVINTSIELEVGHIWLHKLNLKNHSVALRVIQCHSKSKKTRWNPLQNLFPYADELWGVDILRWVRWQPDFPWLSAVSDLLARYAGHFL